MNEIEKKVSVISFPAFFRGLGYGGWANSSEVASLKVATLLYDRILVAAPSSQVTHACKHFANEYKVSLDSLLDVWGSVDEIDEITLYSDEFLENCLSTIGLNFESDLKHTYKEYGKYWYNGLFHSGYFYILSMVALPLWSTIREKESHIALIETSDLPEQGRTTEFQNTIYPKRTENIWNGLAGVGVPDPGELNWQSIITLYESKNKKAFQNKISEIAQGNLNDEIANHLWDIFKESKKDIKSLIVKSVISEIPLPIPINPISIYFSIQDIVEAYKQNNKNVWLSFIAQVRSYRDSPVDLPPSTDAFGWAGRISPDFVPPELPGIPKVTSSGKSTQKSRRKKGKKHKGTSK